MGATEVLADFVSRIDYDDLPVDVITHAKLCILDWLGAALAGSVEPAAKIALKLINGMGGKKESTVIGTAVETSCVDAAFANGIFGHVVECDDVHADALIHPAAAVVPAGIAIAERNGSGGKDLITSVVLGYEAEIRIAIAMMPSHYKFWHTTGTCGTFGAAVAAGKILGLDAKNIIQALGIAGTQASGLIEVFGTMSKPLNAGRAARDGVVSALLAKEDFTSSTRILESSKGYCRAASTTLDVDGITNELGIRFELMRNSFKLHASCGHTHAAIDGLLQLAKDARPKLDAIDEIVVETYPIAVEIVGGNAEPKTISEKKFSIPYCLATALIYGNVSLSAFSEERAEDDEILRLSRKVTVKVGKEFSDVSYGCAKVTLRTRDGTRFSQLVKAQKGDPTNPLTSQELEAKFRNLATVALPTKRVNRIINAIRNLEELKSTDKLTDLLRR